MSSGRFRHERDFVFGPKLSSSSRDLELSQYGESQGRTAEKERRAFIFFFFVSYGGSREKMAIAKLKRPQLRKTKPCSSYFYALAILHTKV